MSINSGWFGSKQKHLGKLKNKTSDKRELRPELKSMKGQFKLVNGEETTALSDVAVIIGRMVTNKTSSVLVLVLVLVYAVFFQQGMTSPHLMVAWRGFKQCRKISANIYYKYGILCNPHSDFICDAINRWNSKWSTNGQKIILGLRHARLVHRTCAVCAHMEQTWRTQAPERSLAQPIVFSPGTKTH